jgi:hypothetical protein
LQHIYKNILCGNYVCSITKSSTNTMTQIFSINFRKIFFCKAMQFIFCIFLFLICATNAKASHFKNASLNWTISATDTVTFTTIQTWRATAFSGVAVGASVGVDYFNFGDGNSAYISLIVTSVDVANDQFTGIAVLKHKYASYGTYTSNMASCCRVDGIYYNGSGDYRMEAKVVYNGSGNTPPISGVPPIINYQTNIANNTYTLPIFDAQSNFYRCFLSTPTQSGAGFIQPPNLTLDSITGQLTFNTVGKTIGTIYVCAVTLVDSVGATSSVEFLLKIVGTSNAPQFNYTITPASGSVINLYLGGSINLKFKATDIDPGDVITMTANGLPNGATFSPPMPVIGTPDSTNFSWTPTLADVGTHVLSVQAQDQIGASSITNVTINVILYVAFIAPTPSLNSTQCLTENTTYTFPFVTQSKPTNQIRLDSITGFTSPITLSNTLPTAYSSGNTTNATWTPTASDWGVHQITAVANDTSGIYLANTFSVVVNANPVITSTFTQSAIHIYQSINYNFTCTDVDIPFGDDVEIKPSGMPKWLSLIDNGNGTASITGMPGCGKAGTYTFTIYAEDIHHHCSAIVSHQDITIVVQNIAVDSFITSIENDTLFGAGNAYLAMNTSIGNVDWYANASGGASLQTANVFTPFVTGDTTFYAQAIVGAITTYTAGITSFPNNYYSGSFFLFFDAINDFTLDSVTIYPVNIGVQTIVINLYNSAYSIISSKTITINNPAYLHPTRVALGFAIPTGSGYAINQSSVYLGYLPSGFSYPYIVPSILSINNTEYGTSYSSYFFDWKISAGNICNSARYPVKVKFGDPAVAVSIKALLSGPYIIGTQLMQDSLRVKSLIPNLEPYSSAPYNTIFTHINGGGAEAIGLNVLNTTGNDAIVDWVFVQLRNKLNSSIVVATKSALIQRDGDIVSASDGTSPLQFNVPADNYYISVKHRNHLGIMGASSIALSSTNTVVDFTDGSRSLYLAASNNNPSPLTGATKIMGGKYAMYAGNCNIANTTWSRYITYNNLLQSDRTSLVAYTTPTGTVNGYSIFDVDMNGYARFNGLNPDRLVILLNVNNSTSLYANEQTPN